MAWIASAIGASAVASIGGSLIQADASKNAANTMANAQLQSAAQQMQMFQQTQANAMPFVQQGQQANMTLGQLLGIQQGTPSAGGANSSFMKPFDPSMYTASPGYQYQLQQSQQAIDANAAAQGRYTSGATLQQLLSNQVGLQAQDYQTALSNYNSQQLQNYNMLQNQAGLGANIGSGLGTQSQQVANQIGQNNVAGAAYQAQAQAAQGNAIGGTIGNIGMMLGAYGLNHIGQLGGGGVGGGGVGGGGVGGGGVGGGGVNSSIV